MASSKEVFALRKAGHLDEAYSMATQLEVCEDSDIWNKRALAWCLIDLIKRDSKNNDTNAIPIYQDQLQKLKFDPEKDELICKHQSYALSMCDPEVATLFRAKNLSKLGRYEEAIELYKYLSPNMAEEFLNDYGWTLYKHAKQLIDQERPNVPLAKGHMVTYLKLPLQKPSKLHSSFLWLAYRLAKNEKLNMVQFLPYWGLENFSTDDFNRIDSDKGELRSLVERVIQQAIKNFFEHSGNTYDGSSYIPILKKLIKINRDNIWITYYLGKMLVHLSEFDEARRYCKEICKQKPSESWTWSLLADAFNTVPELQLLFYANAILLQPEDRQSEKLYIKFSKILADMGYWQYVKYILENVFTNPLESKYVNEIRSIYAKKEYINSASASFEEYNNFCTTLSSKAKCELIADLPWLKAIIGEKFNISSQDGQKITQRRKIYVEIPSSDENELSISPPYECVISEKKFPLNTLKVGSPIFIKGEELSEKNFQIFDFSIREEGTNWDIFTPVPGLINYINTNKNVYHIILDQEDPIELFYPYCPSDHKLNLYDSVEVFLADSNKFGLKIAYLIPIERVPSDKIFRKFEDERIDHLEHYAFTESNYFVPPDLVKKSKLDEYSYVISYYEKDVLISGNAILNYNKKRSSLTWKVINISKINAPEDLEGEY